MSTLRATNIKHESSATNQIVLGADGSIGGTLGDTLAAKGDVAGETWTGTHDFTGATLSGVPAGLSLISTTAFSAVSTVSVNSCFDTTYDSYRIIANISAASAANSVYLRMRASGTDTTTGYYFAYVAGYFTSTTIDYVNGANTTGFIAAYPNSAASFALHDVVAPNLAQLTFVSAHRINASTNGNTAVGLGYLNNSTQYDGFSLVASSGTITGSVSVYGYQK